MKKNYKNFLFGIVATTLALPTSAQVSAYLFAQTQGTYNAVSGGTVFGNTTSDDQVFVDVTVPLGVGAGATGPGLPIGFTFTFNGTPYDRFAINNNGWIALGQSSLTPAVNTNNASGYTGISSTSTAPPALQNHIGALARDIQGQAGSELRVQTIGVTPNQTLVIQWTNYRKFGQTGDNFNFQIRLVETTNAVEVMYGGFVNGPTAGVAEVGLRGNSNADFNNRVTSNVAPWNLSIPGTINTAAVNFDASLFPNSGQIYRWLAPVPCNGAPPTTTAVASLSLVCPGGSSALNLVNAYANYTNTGLSYQWYSSTTSVVGPFTAVANATNQVYAPTNLTMTTWYIVVPTCSNGPVSTTAAVAGVTVQGTTINNIPYNEGFEGISVNNQLPNCSWLGTNVPAVNQTYISASTLNRVPRTGAKFGAFKSPTNGAGDYFYTNGLNLVTGVTYSTNVWYTTDGNLGWSHLSVSTGTSQTAIDMTQIAQVAGNPSGLAYQLLTGTFQVTASGVYYMGIKCIGSGAAQYMSIDDISVTIPCTLNTPSLTVTSVSTACEGSSLSVTASGANTYSWNTGATTSVITVTPGSNVSYTVVGTNTTTGCSSTWVQSIIIKPTPSVFIFASPPTICAGKTSSLNAFGANTYTWSTTGTGPVIVVSPSAATVYTLTGSNTNGCIGTATQQVQVNPLPTVTGANSSGTGSICVGESATLTGVGAATYQWLSPSAIIPLGQVVVSPNTTTTYTVVGTDAAGCSNMFPLTLFVNTCAGITESSIDQARVYPNPASNSFMVELNNNLQKTIDVIDLTGRKIMTVTGSDQKLTLDVQHLAAGVYYVRIQSGTHTNNIKLVKE